jgi:hypothetical protein
MRSLAKVKQKSSRSKRELLQRSVLIKNFTCR